MSDRAIDAVGVGDLGDGLGRWPAWRGRRIKCWEGAAGRRGQWKVEGKGRRGRDDSVFGEAGQEKVATSISPKRSLAKALLRGYTTGWL